MSRIQKITGVFIASLLLSASLQAQIRLEDFDINSLLGKVLTVKKGWAPQFFSGEKKLPKINIVQELLGSKKNTEINKLFKTFKTGRTVYRITNYAGTAIALYGTVKNIINNKDSVSAAVKNQARSLLYTGLGSISAGTVVKLLTKGASYKAVDLFGGAVKKKLLDIISVDMMPAQNYTGRIGYKASIIVKL